MADESRTDESRTEKIIAEITETAANRICGTFVGMEHYHGAIRAMVREAVTGRIIDILPAEAGAAGTWADFRRVIEKYIWRRLDCDLRSNVDPKVVERNRCVLEDFFDTADRWFQEDQRRVSGDGEKGGRKNVKDQKSQDWTVGPNGTSNASEAFLGLSTAVERMIRASAADLIGGNTKAVARLIVSKLAHEHGLRPAKK